MDLGTPGLDSRYHGFILLRSWQIWGQKKEMSFRLGSVCSFLSWTWSLCCAFLLCDMEGRPCSEQSASDLLAFTFRKQNQALMINGMPQSVLSCDRWGDRCVPWI